MSATAKREKTVCVLLPNKEQLDITVGVKSTGQDVFNRVSEVLGIKELYFFGLTVVKDNEHIFLDLEEKLTKYFPKEWKQDSVKGSHKRCLPLLLCLKVQYYVENGRLICERKARRLYYLDLRERVLRSECRQQEEVYFQLAGLALQADLEDRAPPGHRQGDVQGEGQEVKPYFQPKEYFPPWILAKRGVDYLLRHGPKVHRELCGMTSRDAVLHFIRESCRLEDVPVTFYRLQKDKKEERGTALLGLTLRGMQVYQEVNNIRQLLFDFPWSNVGRLTFLGKKFEIQPDGLPSARKLVYYTGSPFRSRHLLLHLSSSHRIYLSLQPALTHLRQLEETEEKKRYRESYISDDLDLDPPGSEGSPGLSRQSTSSPGLSRQSNSSPGLSRQSNSSPGISRQCNSSPGLSQQSNSSPGLSQQSTSSPGLLRQYTSSPGLSRHSTSSRGLSRESSSSHGLSRQSTGSPGLLLQSTGSPGLLLQSTGSPGLLLQSTGSPGLSRKSTGSPGLLLQSTGSPGLSRKSTGSPGLSRKSTGSPGLSRKSTGSPGLSRKSTGSPGLSRKSTGSPGLSRQSTGSPGLSRQSTGSPGLSRQSTGSSGIEADARQHSISMEMASMEDEAGPRRAETCFSSTASHGSSHTSGIDMGSKDCTEEEDWQEKETSVSVGSPGEVSVDDPEEMFRLAEILEGVSVDYPVMTSETLWRESKEVAVDGNDDLVTLRSKDTLGQVKSRPPSVDRHSQSLDDVRLFPPPAPLGTTLLLDSSHSYTFGLPDPQTNVKSSGGNSYYLPLQLHCPAKPSFYGRRSTNCLSLDLLGEEQLLEFIL